MSWEHVYTVNNYYDAPRLGVADVFGIPHIFESPFNELIDEYEDVFLVSPINQELLSLVLEDWAIWLRWNEAYKNDMTTIATHPALPEERFRYDELQQLIGVQLKPNTVNCRQLKATFRYIDDSRMNVEVEWMEENA